MLTKGRSTSGRMSRSGEEAGGGHEEEEGEEGEEDGQERKRTRKKRKGASLSFGTPLEA